jgi:hypothetical protein
MSQTINTVRVRVDSGATSRVQSIQYLPNMISFDIKDAADLQISNNLTGRGVITYNETTQEFVVQDVPRLDGGTY